MYLDHQLPHWEYKDLYFYLLLGGLRFVESGCFNAKYLQELGKTKLRQFVFCESQMNPELL